MNDNLILILNAIPVNKLIIDDICINIQHNSLEQAQGDLVIAVAKVLSFGRLPKPILFR